MIRPRWRFCLICTAVVQICGCGGGSSTSRAYNHLVAASEALKANDKTAALTELTAVINSSPNAWAYFERARLNLDKGDEAAAVADCQEGLKLDASYRDLLWLSNELKKPAPKRF